MLPFNLPNDYSLPDDEVHIWQTRLDSPSAFIEGLRELLSAEERQKADLFHSNRDQKRHTLARGLLRLVVARLTDKSPELLKIGSTPLGKPYLLLDVDQPRIEFNISHSEDLIYMAITNRRAVGIDIERVQDDLPFEMIAKDVFSAIEFDELMAIDPALRLDSFYTCWTRKEALYKAKGKGLTAAPDPYGRSLLGQLPMPMRLACVEEDVASSWTLLDLQAAPTYKAALVFEGTDCRVRRWNWPTVEI
jgi:4'-phosphopantetheinyl transferase